MSRGLSSVRFLVHWCLLALIVGAMGLPAFALRERERSERFDHLLRDRPGGVIATRADNPLDLPATDPLRGAWQEVLDELGGRWTATIDVRTGLPTLAWGAGVNWMPARQDGDSAGTLERLEARARAFIAEHPVVFRSLGAELVLDAEASGPVGADTWQITFRQAVGGVRVEGARLDFQLSHGALVAFGASRLAPIDASPQPTLDVDAARERLDAYLGSGTIATLTAVDPGTLLFVPLDAAGRSQRWTGAIGTGLTHRLIWRFVLVDPGASPLWVGEVDAHSGAILAFYDDTRYGRVRGGIFPISDDGICPSGCEQPEYPMPFVDVSIDGGPSTPTGDYGLFTCDDAASSASTTLAGTYVRVQDNCGAISESMGCDSALDLRVSGGTDCVVPEGSSAGNTHASRSSFFHLNRSMQKGRAWLPDNEWLKNQLTDNVNINNTCNAFWNGTVNFYRSGGGCRNTGEIMGVFVHEWGHGLDQNDGGGYDNPSEAYADIVAFFETRESCIGRGFYTSKNCSGYGDTCLDCTGIRDQDWDKRSLHTPATPSGFLTDNCGGGGGPCGKEVHCEGYVPGEAVWDLATRDLPAMGLDASTSWQIAERLFYLSRDGSGGDAYNCSLPDSDGCGAGSWFHKMRLVDDDDGDLNNGTPHAAAIYAAFARHDIACGAVGDPSNQNSAACPTLAAPQISAKGLSESVELSWDEVAGAASYEILRNELGCERGQIIVGNATAPTSGYLDEGLANDFTVYYRVQAVGANEACLSPVSNCVAIAPQPRAGSVRIEASTYSCSDLVTMRLIDADLNLDSAVADTVVLPVTSSSEIDAEQVLFTETGPDTSKFSASIATASGPPAADGTLQVRDGDVITVSYFDEDDGSGVSRRVFSTALADCATPVLRNLRIEEITDQRLTVRWQTDEPADTVVEWGLGPDLGQTISDPTLVTEHQVLLNHLDLCQALYLRASSTDAFGNHASSPAGASHEASTWDIPGLYYRETFENGANDWTLEGEWESGVPQGLGGSTGLPDPTAAYNNDAVLGNDLSGQGLMPGDYEASSTENATSPTQDATSWTHTKLIVYRQLNVDDADTAAILVVAGGEQEVYSNQGQEILESDYSKMSLDLSSYFDGQPAAALRFRLLATAERRLPDGQVFDGEYSGWNIDDVILKDGSQPDYAACGGCATPPAFRGALAASDDDACAASGVTVSWDAALAWGSGSSGSYNVYRGQTPDFTPDPSNRIATGVAGTSYHDGAAPTDTTVYYIVRAVNDESCTADGGLEDDNLEAVAVSETTSRQAPGAIADLTLTLVNHDHVRLAWSAVAGEDSARIYRSTSPLPGDFSRYDETAEDFYEDRHQGADPQNFFYLVRAANACGQEGP
ncbi:MAG TPA: hypothetical protein ENK10_07485 [Acidobacteria bacterium]|nr:hypothetical protein [Acidobacteriota bacterium]